MKQLETSPTGETTRRRTCLLACADVGLIFLMFVIFAGWPAPDVNEAHYLSKAKHYWNPAWCPGDQFLESADAHEIFYWTFGWLTLVFPLPLVAWIGRVVTWGSIAWTWRRLSFAVVPRPLFAVLSAGLFLLFLQRCHMAGEWVIGGVEAKGFAFPFVLLGMEAIVRGRWRTVWLLLGAASAFHVLVGGWAVVAALFAWLLSGRKQMRLVAIAPFLFCGLLLALPGLIPAIALTWKADPEIVRQANDIYVFQRLDHHLVFLSLVEDKAEWHKHRIVRHVALGICWLAVAVSLRRSERVRRLNVFVAGAVAIAVAGIAIDYATHRDNELAAKLLKFYWFRLSDAVLPMGVAFSVICAIDVMQRRWVHDSDSKQNNGSRSDTDLPPSPDFAGERVGVKGLLRQRLVTHGVTVAAMLAVGVNLGCIIVSRQNDFRPRADQQSLAADPDDPQATRRHFENWRNVCGWISQNTPEDARFLTPFHQQTFKWYAGRSEVATNKDIPQDAEGIVRWWKTLNTVYPGRVKSLGLCARGDGKLAELARRYHAQYIIIDRGWRSLSLPRVYPPSGIENTSFEIYRVPPPPPPQSEDYFPIQNDLDNATTD